MAGDWIKIELTLPDKPEVIRMAFQLKIDQDAVAGKLFRVWSWADQNSVDGNGIPVTEAFLNRLTDCKRFTVAMRAVGWLEGEDGLLSFPNFGRHNGRTAKERAQTNRRVADSRQRNCNGDSVTSVTVPPLEKPLPEKRREEITLSPIAGEAPRVDPPPRGMTYTRPEGYPKSEEVARAMAVPIGVDPDFAGTWWQHYEGMGYWPSGNFSAHLKAKQGFKAADLGDKLVVSQALQTTKATAGKGEVQLTTKPQNGF